MADLTSARSDLDFLTELMKAKQRFVAAERNLDDAKEEVKVAKNEINRLLDGLEPHVMRRRDDLTLPKFPMFDSPSAEEGQPPAV